MFECFVILEGLGSTPYKWGKSIDFPPGTMEERVPQNGGPGIYHSEEPLYTGAPVLWEF